MRAGNPNLLPWQRNCLWGVIMTISLGLATLGIVLNLRYLRYDTTLPSGKNTLPPAIPCTPQPCTTASIPSTPKPSTPASIPSTPQPSTPASPYDINSAHKNFRFAAVTSAADPCNTMGTDILAKKGGSAVDAAIVTVLCVGVVNLHYNGIGGGHFMTVYERPNNGTDKKEFTTIFARERAPGGATVDMFQNTSSLVGGLSIAVPGEIKGFHYAWQKFGRLPWSVLFQPVIDLCKNGIVVNWDLARFIGWFQDAINDSKSLKEMLSNPDGSLKKEGDIVYRPKLVSTLEIIAMDPEAFYDRNSTLAQDIVADIADYDGIVSIDDLASYTVEEKVPISIRLQNGNYTVYSPTAPSGGLVLLFILNILDGYNFTPADMKDTESTVLTFHRITEAFKYAYAKRSELGDEKFVPEVYSLITNLTSEWFADVTREKIDDNMTYNISHYNPSFQITSNHGTSHIAVLSAEGSAVSITSTINYIFGSTVVGNRTGILFNDEMDDFSSPGAPNAFGVEPSPANFIKPGKVPLSSMSPLIITDSNGKVVFVIGAAGGTRITTGIALVTMLKLWFGFPLNDATNYPRFHHQLSPNAIMIEPGFDEAIKQGLAEKGHNFLPQPIASEVQSIFDECNVTYTYSTDLCINGVTDGRSVGIPDGY